MKVCILTQRVSWMNNELEIIAAVPADTGLSSEWVQSSTMGKKREYIVADLLENDLDGVRHL